MTTLEQMKRWISQRLDPPFARQSLDSKKQSVAEPPGTGPIVVSLVQLTALVLLLLAGAAVGVQVLPELARVLPKMVAGILLLWPAIGLPCLIVGAAVGAGLEFADDRFSRPAEARRATSTIAVVAAVTGAVLGLFIGYWLLMTLYSPILEFIWGTPDPGGTTSMTAYEAWYLFLMLPGPAIAAGSGALGAWLVVAFDDFADAGEDATGDHRTADHGARTGTARNDDDAGHGLFPGGERLRGNGQRRGQHGHAHGDHGTSELEETSAHPRTLGQGATSRVR